MGISKGIYGQLPLFFTGSITGWGRRSEFGKISPILREIHLPILSNKECMDMYKFSGKRQWIPNTFLCAGTKSGGADSCEGKKHWNSRLYIFQGSTEGGFLPSAEAEAEGAKKLRPSAEDQSRSRRFQIIEILNLFVYKV